MSVINPAKTVLLPISHLRPATGPGNTVALVDPTQVTNLKISLEAGLTLPPITVKPQDGYYEIVSGLEIFSAHGQCGRQEVPCVIQGSASVGVNATKSKVKELGPKPILSPVLTERMKYCYDQYVNGSSVSDIISRTGISNANLYIRVWYYLQPELKRHLDTKVLPIGAADELIRVDTSMQSIVFNAVMGCTTGGTIKLDAIRNFVDNNPSLVLQNPSVKNIPKVARSSGLTNPDSLTGSNNQERRQQASQVLQKWLVANQLDWSDWTEIAKAINLS